MPDPTADLRRAIRDAARSIPIRLGPNALDIARRGGPIHLNGGETDQLVDAVMAALDEAFPPRQLLDSPPEMSPEDVAAWRAGAMPERLDVRAALRDRIARGVSALAPDMRDPDAVAEAALDALSDGGEWLMDLAEEYQRRAHAAERALADRSEPAAQANPAARWTVRVDLGVVLCAVLACAAASLVQWLTRSEMAGDLSGLPVLGTCLAVLIWRRRKAGAR